MAEGKRTFLMRADEINIFNRLSDDEAGRLIKHIFAYVNDKDPEATDRVTELTFEPIKQRLKAELKTWLNSCDKKRTNGQIGNLKRYNPDLYELYAAGEIDLSTSLERAESRKCENFVAKLADKDKDKDKDKEVIGASKSPPELGEVIDYFRVNGYSVSSAKLAFDYYEASKGPTGRVWKDSKGQTVKNWKQKMRGVWFRPEHEQKAPKKILY
jgi:hypothetical protein